MDEVAKARRHGRSTNSLPDCLVASGLSCCVIGALPTSLGNNTKTIRFAWSKTARVMLHDAACAEGGPCLLASWCAADVGAACVRSTAGLPPNRVIIALRTNRFLVIHP